MERHVLLMSEEVFLDLISVIKLCFMFKNREYEVIGARDSTRMGESNITRQLFAGIAATLSALCVGFHVGWPAPSLPKLLADDSDVIITSDQSSWIVSLFLLGGIFGTFIGVAVIDRYGRKLSLLMIIVPSTSSCIIIGLAKSYWWWFVIARFISGLSMGMMYTIAPIYLGEITDDNIRGALGAVLNVMANGGILLVYCIGPWVSRAVLASFGGVLPLFFGLIFIWMPESPYFLIMKNKSDDAKNSLAWLRGEKSVNEELKKVQASVEFDKKNAGSVKDLVLIPGNRKALIIICGLIAAQNLSGITAILAYSSLIFEASGSTLDSSISVIIIGVVQLLSGVLTVFTVDLIGRRPLLLISAFGTIIFLAGETLYFYLQSIGTDVSGISWIPVTAMVGYIIFYVLGLGCVPHVVLSEMFPCNVKALASMVFTITGTGIGIAVTKVYQIVADKYGIHVPFFGFGVITIFSFIFIYITLPETKRRSFRSIQNELHKTTKSKIVLEELNVG